jgi:N-acyl-D-aspartate/D-glutamate deacylase
MTTTIPWLEQVAARNRRPVMIAALFVDPNDPQRVFGEFEQISAARSRGRELWGHVGCFPLGMEFTLRHPYPLEALLSWRPAIEAEGSQAYERVLGDAAFRAAIKAEARGRTVPNRFSYHTLEHMTLKSVAQQRHQGLVGRNVAAMAREAGKDAFDWFLDFGLDGELDAMVDCQLFNTDEDAVSRLMRHPHAQVTLSDAGAHLSFLCDAGFGLHLFGHWARERGDLSLEQAVQAVTSRPAQLYRIPDRGRLAVGACADLILFDPASVGRGPKRRVFDLPAGASRIDTPAVGLYGVWVNGTHVVDEDGPIRDAGRPGKLMREFAA